MSRASIYHFYSSNCTDIVYVVRQLIGTSRRQPPNFHKMPIPNRRSGVCAAVKGLMEPAREISGAEPDTWQMRDANIEMIEKKHKRQTIKIHFIEEVKMDLKKERHEHRHEAGMVDDANFIFLYFFFGQQQHDLIMSDSIGRKERDVLYWSAELAVRENGASDSRIDKWLEREATMRTFVGYLVEIFTFVSSVY